MCSQQGLDRRLCLAPMLDWTNQHFRYFIRLLSPHALLYTEMVTTGALLYGDVSRHLSHHPSEYPLALQLGGADPEALARCVSLAKAEGFSEVNLNVGCPSDRVQKGKMGACLMLEPALLRECVAAMVSAADGLPVTVKTRIGVDDHDRYEDLHDLVQSLANQGAEAFIIHARKAWLKGLSPKQNREVPPLCYDVVYQLKKDLPDIPIIMNGGVVSLDAVYKHLFQVDGVMIGRSAYQNPFLFAQIDQALFDPSRVLSRQAIVLAYRAYAEKAQAQGVSMSLLIRPLLNLFNGLKGARNWRRTLSTRAHQANASITLMDEALLQLGPDVA